MTRKYSPAEKLAIVLELIKDSHECVCTKCGHSHETSPGPLAGISREKVIEILNGGEK